MEKRIWGVVLFAAIASGLLIPRVPSAEPAVDTGAVEGKIVVTAPSRPSTAVPTPTPKEDTSSYGYTSGSSEREALPEEIVVYLKNVPGTYPPPEKHVRLDQKYLQFTRRVLPVLKGTVVDFTNNDPVYHNVFTSSKSNHFDLGRKKKGQRSSVKMNRPEVPVNVYCEIHANMKSNLLVLDNPFFTTVRPGKPFKIKGVPPGTYTLVAWHDYWEPVERTVTVKRGGTTSMDVVLDQVRK